MRKLHVFLISLFICIPCIAQADTASNSPEDDCFPQDHPDYEEWVRVGKPACWCFSRQCRGDIDGRKYGPFWVQIFDLELFKAAFNKTDAQLPPGGICADLNHIKHGPFRVQVLDLDIFMTYFNKAEMFMPDCFCWICPWP